MDRAIQICVYQCLDCRNIVADSTAALRIELNEESIVFSSVSGFVVEETKMMMSSFGNDSGCVFVSVTCRCGNTLGRKYISTVPHLDGVRNQYCLFQDNLYSWQTNDMSSFQAFNPSCLPQEVLVAVVGKTDFVEYEIGSRSTNSLAENSTLDVPDDSYLMKCALIKFNVTLYKLVDFLKTKGIIENHELADFDLSEGYDNPLTKDIVTPSEDSSPSDSGRSSSHENSTGERSHQNSN